MTTQTEKAKSNAPALKDQVNITDQVLARVNSHKQAGLKLPQDYSAENALKSAYLVLQDVKDKNGKLAIESCSKVSVANSLFEMVVRGLSPLKKQCYFIAYGDKLSLSPSYFGNIATARRVGLKNITANIIYEGDEFEFELDANTGRHRIIKHTQKLENIDINKIKGAYAVFDLENGITDVEIMNIKQIKQSWLQGAAKGNSGAHQNFTDEMAKKTVINRACKRIINSSDDGYLYDGDEPVQNTEQLHPEANGEMITMTDAEVIEETKPVEQPAPENENAAPDKLKANPGVVEQGSLNGPGF